tara:strand:+ start:2574 stop:3404 length:831 start_codon:yes stop_codon:yes gene_type:complete
MFIKNIIIKYIINRLGENRLISLIHDVFHNNGLIKHNCDYCTINSEKSIINIDEPYNYINELDNYFSSIGTNFDLAKDNLMKSAGPDILFFQSNKGQQIEALLFSAISIIKNDVYNILEIGTGSGANTYILSCLFPNSTVYSYDLPETDINYESLAWRKHDDEFYKRVNRKNIVFVEKNSFFTLSDSLPQFDLIYVDGGHDYPVVAWDAMFSYNQTRSDGFIIFDDYNRGNSISDSGYNDVNHLIEFLSKIIKEDVIYLPWAGYDNKARRCLIRKE